MPRSTASDFGLHCSLITFLGTQTYKAEKSFMEDKKRR